MFDNTDDLIIRHLRRQEWPLTAWLFGSIELDRRYFDSSPNFAAALQRIEDIETIAHFNYDDPTLESGDEGSGELTDTHYRVKIKCVRKFKRVRAHTPFAIVAAESGFLVLTPARYWSFLDENYSTGDTKEIGLERFCYEQKLASSRPSDEILQETWKHATKSGDRDMRYKDNINAYLVQRYGVAMRLESGSKWELAGLSEDERERVFKAFQDITDQESDLGEKEGEQSGDYRPSKSDREYSETLWCEALDVPSGSTRSEIEAAYQGKMRGLYLAREEGLEWARQKLKDGSKEPWYDVLSVSQEETTAAEINAAYMKKIKQYHPDRVSGLGEKLRLVAEMESKRLNAARKEGLDWIRRDEQILDRGKDDFSPPDPLYEEEVEENEAWYVVLAVDPDATIDEIEAAYYKTMDYFQDALRLAENCLG